MTRAACGRTISVAESSASNGFHPTWLLTNRAKITIIASNDQKTGYYVLANNSNSLSLCTLLIKLHVLSQTLRLELVNVEFWKKIKREEQNIRFY